MWFRLECRWVIYVKRDSIYDKSGAYSCCGSIIVYMAGGAIGFSLIALVNRKSKADFTISIMSLIFAVVFAVVVAVFEGVWGSGEQWLGSKEGEVKMTKKHRYTAMFISIFLPKLVTMGWNVSEVNVFKYFYIH